MSQRPGRCHTRERVGKHGKRRQEAPSRSQSNGQIRLVGRRDGARRTACVRPDGSGRSNCGGRAHRLPPHGGSGALDRKPPPAKTASVGFPPPAGHERGGRRATGWRRVERAAGRARRRRAGLRRSPASLPLMGIGNHADAHGSRAVGTVLITPHGDRKPAPDRRLIGAAARTHYPSWGSETAA